tara:strand:+ start:188 stop:1066 length:879 start_codon:yes stop_codon:yes gene_type:complete
MNKFLERFYLVSKLSTVFLLLGIIFFISFIFWQSYNKIDRSNNRSDFDENFEMILGHLDKNTEEIKNLNIQIDENQNKYKEINQLLSNQQNSDILTKENKVLKDEINKLSIEIQKLNSKIFSKEKQKINDSKQKIEIDENLINLIRMKFENGSNVYEELKLLKKIINDETDVAYLEKLFVLSDRKFRGLDHIKIEFKKMMQDYMNIYYLKNNDNFFIRSISNFIIIEPNSEFDIENQEIKLFSIIQEKIERNDIKTAVFYINQIDKNEFFNSWINQANIYLDFNNNLEKLFN